VGFLKLKTVKKFKNLFKMNNSEKEQAEIKQEQEIVNESNDAVADETADQLAETTEINDSKEVSLADKLAEANDKYLRLYSDFDNYRKRTLREKTEQSKTAGEDIFKTILPVLDDFERGIKATESASDINAVKEGMNLIFHKLKNMLQQKGLSEMESKGLLFDADLHEAITNIPAPDESLKGKVVDELEKGYLLNGKVIRFAKVVVGA
jgi:molecular chaperone GrpE